MIGILAVHVWGKGLPLGQGNLEGAAMFIMELQALGDTVIGCLLAAALAPGDLLQEVGDKEHPFQAEVGIESESRFFPAMSGQFLHGAIATQTALHLFGSAEVTALVTVQLRAFGALIQGVNFFLGPAADLANRCATVNAAPHQPFSVLAGFVEFFGRLLASFSRQGLEIRTGDHWFA